jgi:mono/diheme cytochrome c family protein
MRRCGRAHSTPGKEAMRYERGRAHVALAALVAFALPAGAAMAADPVSAARRPPEAAARSVERGRYIAIIGGCNDCHTAGYAPAEGRVPESEWLKGDAGLGFRGPWGTTYASNLRLVVAGRTEDEWVRYARELRARPPMPWFTLNRMSTADLRALYRFIRQLGPPGQPVAAFVPPGQESRGPVVLWPSPPK